MSVTIFKPSIDRTEAVGDGLKEGYHRLYVDGGYSQKFKLGAYALVVVNPDGEIIERFCQGIRDKTNQVAELRAMWLALSWAMKHPELTYAVTTDSQYVKCGLTDWLEGWKKRGWKTASGGVVANQDLWQLLDPLYQQVKDRVQICWVKGHAGHVYNEEADRLCSEKMNYLKSEPHG